MRSIIMVAIVGVALVYSGVASADTDGGVVVVGGKSPEREREIAGNAIRDALRVGGLSLVDKSFSAKETDAITGCLRRSGAWPCIATVLRDKRIQRITFATVDAQGRTLKITQRILGARIDSIFVGQRFCEQCTDDTLALSATELTKELLDRLAVHSGRTVLSVKSSPQGATVLIDGNLVGATDISVDITPGRHIVTIERDGYETVARTVYATEGQTADVSVTLQRAEGVSPIAPRSPNHSASTQPSNPVKPTRSRLLPGIAVGAGSLAVLTGLILVAIDEDPINVPDVEVPLTYRDTATGGLALAAGGTIAIGVGVYLWRKHGRPPQTVPTLAPTSGGGAVIGIARRF